MRADLVEITWVLLALLGVGYSVRAWLLAQGDLSHLEFRARGNGLRRVLARATRRREAIRILIHTLFLLAGLVAFIQPSPPRTLINWIVIGMLFAVAAVMIWGTWADLRDRKRVDGWRH